jgi:2-octaprenyl-6-methoxyphenol hydroxylase
MTKATHDLLVVGGGMVGATFAVAVARAGLRVALIDREAPAALQAAPFDGRASAIAYSSHRLLATIGVWPHLAEHAEAIADIRVSDGESRLFLHFDHRELGNQPMGFMVENRFIRQALFAAAAALPALDLRAPATLAALDRGAVLVEATLAGGERLAAPLAIDASGRNSALRRQANIDVIEWTYPQTAIVCTAAHERPHRGVAHERFLPAGPFAILPLPGNRSSLVWTERQDLAPAILRLDERAFAHELRRRFGDFLGAVRVEGPRWSYPLAVHHAHRYIADRLALIGDAAHGIHPIAGQGVNLGFRDAAALAEVLVDAMRLGLDLGARPALETYERWRRFDNTVLIAVTDGLNRLFANDIAPIRLARDLGLATVNEIPPLKRFFMEHARGTVGKLPRLLEGAAL